MRILEVYVTFICVYLGEKQASYDDGLIIYHYISISVSLRICLYNRKVGFLYDAGFMMVLLIYNFRITMCNPIPPFILRMRSHHRLIGDKHTYVGLYNGSVPQDRGVRFILCKVVPYGHVVPPAVVSWFINCSRPPLVALKHRELSRIIQNYICPSIIINPSEIGVMLSDVHQLC